MTSKPKQETLTLQAQPRRVTRFKKKVVIGLSAVLSASLCGATWLALNPPTLHRASNDELTNTQQKSVADGLNGLPRTYGDMQQKTQLGAPMPGDVGAAMIKREQAFGVRPDPEEEAARGERLRQAQKARAAEEAGVFFQLVTKSQAAAKSAAVSPNANASPFGTSVPQTNAGADPNGQNEKLAFLNSKASGDIYNPHPLQQPASPYQVMAGTVIAASLVTGLNSDLPGYVIAQVTENVFDTVSGHYLLIPQGTRLLGKYDSVVAYGQKRALVVWNRLILPDGSSVVIDNLPATDTQGYAGLEDGVDFHTWQLIKGVVLSSLLSIGSEASFGTGQQSDLLRVLQRATGNSVNQAGQSLTERNLNIQPTLTMRPGWPLRVIVHKDLVLKPYGGTDERP
jgi:type IV secretion system protein VirB10